MYHDVRWTTDKIASRLSLISQHVYRKHYPLSAFYAHILPDTEPENPLVNPQIDARSWPVVEPYQYWGSWNSNFTLRTTFRRPGDWGLTAPIALYLPIGNSGDFSHPEALVYIDGVPYAGCDRHHQEVLLPEHVLDGDEHLLALHGWTGRGGSNMGVPGTQLFMRPCELVQIDSATRGLLAAARVALGAVNALDTDVPARGLLLNALDEAFKLIDLRTPGNDAFYESVPMAHEALKAGIDKAGNPLDVRVVAAGHAHIDVAWLWPLAQARRKAGRTFHTALHLMDQFPEYHFTQSQPQLYEFVRQDYPALFENIKARVADGHWEVTGGMWVEADCNITGPESLARQFLLGRAFFRDHFGTDAETPVLWLPDVFGYAGNLPQLMKEAGLEYFFTTKIGWNQYNRLPYDSFWWQGLDGTRVLTHFTTTPSTGGHWLSTYNGEATPEQNLGTWKLFQQKEHQQELLMAFGYGDGGGGPTTDMLENIREMAECPGMPRMRQGSVGEFFRRLESGSGNRLPVWNGELYLEYHRGTYTTQSRNKCANRKSEFLLHDAEFLATLAALAVSNDAGYRYPSGILTDAWKLVCLNQFHDIIPGSSIHQVYVESLAHYEKIQDIGEQVVREALDVLHSREDADMLVINPTSFAQTGVAEWPERLPEDRQFVTVNDVPVVVQRTAEGTLIDVANLAPFSILPISCVERASSRIEEVDNFTGLSPNFLENNFLYVELNEAGDIIRIFDKIHHREVLPMGAVANQFLAFEDRPIRHDAWDIDIFYDDKCWFSEPADSIEVVEEGPLRVTLQITRRILNSEYVQRISLYHHASQIVFDTEILWCERSILLKTAFPVAVLSPTATYEIQWGNVERPTHWNTSWDWARFESCAQKWVDLSEGDYGVSLLNDCKYGHDIRDNVMRLSLLRGTTEPDPEADLGTHRFTYALLPHTGRVGEQTIAAAYALNDPLIVSHQPLRRQDAGAPKSTLQQSLIRVNRSNVVIETVKWAEDGDGIIVRCYESQRQRGEVTFTTSFLLDRVERVNILEEKQDELTTDGSRVSLFVMPYQIITLRFVPK